MEKEEEEKTNENSDEESEESPEDEKENLEEILKEESAPPQLDFPVNFKAPVLGQIAESPQTHFALETQIKSSPMQNSKDKNDPFNYRANSEEEEEKKYVSHSEISKIPEKIDANSMGRERENFASGRRMDFVSSENIPTKNSSPEQIYGVAERIDVESAGREKRKMYDIK